MTNSILARTLHKWIGLIVGLQVLIWLATGLYMVVVDLDFIHGDTLVKNLQQPISVPDTSALSVAGLRAQYPAATSIGLSTVMSDTFYTITTPEHRYLVNPGTAEVISPLDEKTARNIALFHFNGDAPIASAALITSTPPMEIQTRRLPLWRINFADRFSTSFYIDPYSGRLVTRRHQYWRIFDVMWMLHIMDYTERTDAHNLLLIVAEYVGLTLTISGFWLLYYRLKRRKPTVASK